VKPERTGSTTDRPAIDLARILPPPEWLTPEQRRLWRYRTDLYVRQGNSRAEAEQEAMAELVMTGKL
jgi:hypothetical protein